MSKRKLHYDDWDGGTEADQDMPDQLFCRTKSGYPQFAQRKADVTCKRCLKTLKDLSGHKDHDQ